MTVRKKKVVKPKVITTIEMEEAIARKFGFRTNIIVPNISWGLRGMHECDIFIIKQTGYCVEIEIKRSKSDLLADFKKGHQHQDNRIKEFYYAMPISLLKTCEELIPKHAGIITCDRSDYGKKLVFASFRRNPVPNRNAIKLSHVEQFKVARLGTMRIWSLKNKIIKMQNEKNKEKK
jgi:hypothetical protein